MINSGKISIVPLSIEIEGIWPSLTDYINTQFGCTAHINEQNMDLSDYFNPERIQYSANDILNWLLNLSSGSDEKVIGLTGVDIYIPVLTFIFGQAYLGGQAGIISDYRLKNEFYGMTGDEELYNQRLIKCVVHELGHMFGLKHCSGYGCVMQAATYVEDIDQKSAYLCGACSSLIS